MSEGVLIVGAGLWYGGPAGEHTGPRDDTLIGHVSLERGTLTVSCSWCAPVRARSTIPVGRLSSGE